MGFSPWRNYILLFGKGLDAAAKNEGRVRVSRAQGANSSSVLDKGEI
jgi:hypothetical protein